MTEQYNAEHCRERHDTLQHLISDKISAMQDTLRRIELQVTATNGRVTRLEKWQIAVMVAFAVLAAVKWPVLLTVLKGLGG